MNRICWSTCKVNTEELYPLESADPHFFLKALVLFLMMSFGPDVSALPVGGTVTAGSASVGGSGGSMIITQSTQNTAINWQSFNIGQSEAVRFVQPNSNSVALNRVLGSDPTSIFGSLSANGKVFLVNPNGILFRKGAQVNVDGLVASTLNVTDSGFMAGDYKFVGTSKGMILNQGSIITHADGGYVALLGGHVSNDGIIAAKLGTVVLAAGSAITLDVAGDGLLNVTVNQGAVNALVQNSGLIQADGGQVLLTAQAAENLLQSVVNNTGIIQAQTVENRNGTIKLLADMQSGTVNVGGTLDVSAPNSGDGGFIETSGSHVVIADSAKVNALAPHGKTGSWLVDPTDFTISEIGDMTSATLDSNLATSNVTISSNGLVGTAGNINVNTPILWAGATTLTLNAIHDVNVNAAMTANTAGANIVLTAGNDVNAIASIHTVAAASSISISAVNDVSVASIIGTAANTAINVSAGHNLTTTGLINAVAADSSISLSGGNNVGIGGPVTATAGTTTININAGQDATISAPITAIAAGSLIGIIAGRDLTTTTTAAIAAVAATTSIDLSAGRTLSVNSAIAAGAADSAISMSAGQNINVNAALAASAAGSSISLISGLGGSGPGVVGGTVTLAAAVASLDTTIRFNPNSYANTSAEIAAYVTKVTGGVDAKAWVFAQGNNRIYDGTNLAILTLRGNPVSGGDVSITSGTALFDTGNAGTSKTISFNGSALSGADVSKFGLFAATGTTTANITPAPLTVTASNASKIYGHTPTLNGFATEGLANGETIGSVTETSSGTAATANVAGGPYAIMPSSATGGTFTASNYTIAYANGALTVIPANLTVTASNVSKTYGQTQSLTTFTQTGLLNGESIGKVTETSPGTASIASVMGGPYAITPGNATGGTFTASNYTIAYANGTLTVVPSSLLVTVANAMKTFGETPTLTAFSIAGLVNGETVGAFTETSLGTAASASVMGSPYPITISSASGGTFTPSNYNITYINGVLTVTPQLQPLSLVISPARSNALQAEEQSFMTSVVLAGAPPELLAVVPVVAASPFLEAVPAEIQPAVPVQ